MTVPAASRLTPRRIAIGLLVAVAVLALAMTIRYGLIEPREMGLACVEASPPWWCGPRELLVLASTGDGWGMAALGAGIAALMLRWRRAAWIAYGLGLAGLVLYDAGLAAAGFLLGLIGLLRR